MWSRLQAMCLVIPLLCVFGCGQSESERNRQAAIARGDDAVKEFEKLSIQPKVDEVALSAIAKKMDAVWARVEEHDREAKKYPKPKYSSVSDAKYLAAVERGYPSKKPE